ncbi:NAD(+) synthase [Anaerotalea alkaliphila]|uniref:Glutamine-dependent NAD(+) synthetase n=1 Tax=Anaerotalea alkaliphila TaxID=2662126 RepID=A0A7X5HUP4_9FIRM|nr:NAD(+) synthase [Anaerotalea alkaliphila]NDL66910.1 NAD(+) synthase [Anaerotalea alkaliphila]
MGYDLIRVACASPKLYLADPERNAREAVALMEKAATAEASVLVFPELSLTGYTCQDLFFQPSLLEKAKEALVRIKEASRWFPCLVVAGIPLAVEGALYNCAAVVCGGSVLGFVPKTYLPNYHEFYEKRWFAGALQCGTREVLFDGESVPLGTDLLFSDRNFPDFKLAVEICEDLWAPVPPSSLSALAGATAIANLSASNDLVGKLPYRKQLVSQQSARSMTAYLYASSGFGESTTDLVFGGHCMVYENGVCVGENERFQLDSSLLVTEVDMQKLLFDRRQQPGIAEGAVLHAFPSGRPRVVSYGGPVYDVRYTRPVDPYPFVPGNLSERHERCQEIFQIQMTGLARRLEQVRSSHVVIGISGGLDSTLAFLVCAKTFQQMGYDLQHLHAVTMPGFGTTDRTYNNAVALIKALGADFLEIPIGPATLLHFQDIGHDPQVHDVTYENSQARERTQVLMDLGNKLGGIVVGTGDLSELALGWATYNGDHMSMYGVNASIPKTLVRYLVDWVASTQVPPEVGRILLDILDTPVSPELLPPDESGNIRQKTEELVGPYELHDFFLYHFLRHGFPPAKIAYLAETAFKGTYDGPFIHKWLKVFYRRFFAQQFKRSCLPDGPKVGSVCLSPRGDWRMPSDASAAAWLEGLS